MPEHLGITINGQRIEVPAGCSVAAAVFRAGSHGFRRSLTGELRGPLCGMGICFECRVTINGQPHQRSCQFPCQNGMEILTDDNVKSP